MFSFHVASESLMDMHDMPPSVCVKLIHIHFHLNNGEILAVRELNTPPHGKIPFLSPGKLIQTLTLSFFFFSYGGHLTC